jgi:hypothetical protein
MPAKPWETNEEMLARVEGEKPYWDRLDAELADTLEAERYRLKAKEARRVFRCNVDESCGARDE